jgi:hypothetical protein
MIIHVFKSAALKKSKDFLLDFMSVAILPYPSLFFLLLGRLNRP